MRILKDVLVYASPLHVSRLLEILGLNICETDIPRKVEIEHITEWVSLGRKMLNQRQRHAAKTTVERIFAMTDDLGFQALLSETRRCKRDWNHANRYNFAIDVLYYEPELFRQAEHIGYANRYREGYSWSCFRVSSPVPFSEHVPLDSFGQELRTFFGFQEERDQLFIDVIPRIDEECEIDHWLVVVYRDGLPVHIKKMAPTGLDTDCYRPVREYALLYHPRDGRLEVVSKLRLRREKLGTLFARTVLGVNTQLRPIVPDKWNLELFHNRPVLGFDNRHPLEREIEWVAVTGMHLSSRLAEGGFNVHCREDMANCSDIYDLLELHNQLKQISKGACQIKKVKLSVRFQASADGTRPEEIIRFFLAHPNQCSLNDNCARARYIRTVLLPRWGLVLKENSL